MSSKIREAASAASLATVTAENATPALADQWEAKVVDAIANVQDPDEAERLLAEATAIGEIMRLAKLGEDRERRWKALRLKAERRYGELLPPKEPGKRTDRQPVASSNRSTQADRSQANKARKVAAIPQDSFDEYVDNDPKPSREGLLRNANRPKTTEPPPPSEAGTTLWENDDVIAWAARRIRAGRKDTQIARDSKDGAFGWPLPGVHLGQNAAEKVCIVVRDRLRRGDTMRRRKPTESGRRLHQLHADRRAGRTAGDIWQLQVAIGEAVSRLEMFDLPELDWTEETEGMVMDLYEDLERHAKWNDTAIDAVTAHMGDLARQRKLQRLRARADDASSTPNERATAARLAERLERRRNAERLYSA